MKIAISYFYKIRFFKPWMIPLSTAKWDPEWYHQGKDYKHTFIDKNGVINGYRIESFAPGATCEGLCGGPAQCGSDPGSCAFLSTYRKQLAAIDFESLKAKLEEFSNQLKASSAWPPQEPVFVFIVYEPPQKKCSERGAIMDWFKSHGCECNELTL